MQFKTEPKSTSVILEVNNLYTWFRSNDFLYKLWFIPVTGYLDVDVGSTMLKVKVEFTDQVINGRHIPKININEA